MDPATTAPSVTTSPAPSCNENWKGDNFCDDDNNHEACEYDGGDCCGNTADYWDYYCDECQCLDPQ